MKKSKLYWLLQLAGWCSLLLINFLPVAALLPILPMALVNIFILFVGIFSSHLYRLFIKKRKWVDLKVVKLIPKVVGASVLQGAITGGLYFVAIIFAFAVYVQYNPEGALDLMGLSGGEDIMDEETVEQIKELNQSKFTPRVFIGIIISAMMQYAIFYISWSALYFAYQFLQKNRQVEIEKWKLQASVKDAELSALKSQVNPHFIFNSLNNIRSLVAEDTEKARDSITHLSELLRFSVQFDQYEKANLEKEIEVVKDYLELESIQLEERLSFKFELDEESLDMPIPPMSIQTLVENAIKHSINNLPNGGEICVESELTNHYLNIYVKNTGQLKEDKDPKKRKGIGIKNARERLRLLYGENASLTVENLNENMVCATIKIPL